MKKIIEFLDKHRIIKTYYWGACHCGNEGSCFNVYKNHWFRCDDCKTVWWIGQNLFSTWQYENEEIWQKDIEKYNYYNVIEPVYNSLEKSFKNNRIIRLFEKSINKLLAKNYKRNER
ncbi:MAG: hypothetical protein V1649_01810 [Patescibacteria group bacterium]